MKNLGQYSSSRQRLYARFETLLHSNLLEICHGIKDGLLDVWKEME